MIVRGRAVGVLVAIATVLWPCHHVGCAAAAADVPGRAFDRFITIWLENEDFSKVEQNADIQALAGSGILLTNYYGLTHPSQPNYMASVAGDYFGLDHDGVVSVPENVSTVVDLLDSQGIEWRVYMEDAPGPGFMAEGSTDANGQWSYVRKHNPLVSFQSVTNNGSRLLNMLSLEDFDREVRARTLPQWAHISPNMLNDGHNTSLAYAADWARRFLEPLLADEYFGRKTLVLLTYDESETYAEPNHIASLLLGGAVPDQLRGTTDATFYTHYSILATLENNWRLPHLGRYDVGANVFDLVARATGYRNRDVNQSSLDLSVSYDGLLNSRPGSGGGVVGDGEGGGGSGGGRDDVRGVPAPNPFLTGAGGQGIVQTLPDAWLRPKGAQLYTPYDGSADVPPDGRLKPPVAKLQKPSSSAAAPAAPGRRLVGMSSKAVLVATFVSLLSFRFWSDSIFA